MLTALHRRLKSDQDGFTLIELMVVLLIVALLITIAIPSFMTAQQRAANRAAQADLRTSLAAVRSITVEDDGRFTGLSAAALAVAEGGVTWVNAPGTTADVGWDADLVPTPQLLQLSRVSKSGRAYGVRLHSNGRMFYCEGDIADVDDTSDACANPHW